MMKKSQIFRLKKFQVNCDNLNDKNDFNYDRMMTKSWAVQDILLFCFVIVIVFIFDSMAMNNNNIYPKNRRTIFVSSLNDYFFLSSKLHKQEFIVTMCVKTDNDFSCIFFFFKNDW